MISKSIKEYYRKNLAEHGADARGMGWKDEDAQRVRFEQLIKVFHTQLPFSVNDLGCGAGHFLTFLQKSHPSVEYRGYDVMEEMIEASSKKFRKSERVEFLRIKSPAEMKAADYTMASGIFNLKFEEKTIAWKAYILETLDHMNERSQCGFAFNALTKYSDKEFMKPELYYADPSWLFDHCKKHYAKNVALLHDYGLYDFTILVKKNF